MVVAGPSIIFCGTTTRVGGTDSHQVEVEPSWQARSAELVTTDTFLVLSKFKTVKKHIKNAVKGNDERGANWHRVDVHTGKNEKYAQDQADQCLHHLEKIRIVRILSNPTNMLLSR